MLGVRSCQQADCDAQLSERNPHIFTRAKSGNSAIAGDDEGRDPQLALVKVESAHTLSRTPRILPAVKTPF